MAVLFTILLPAGAFLVHRAGRRLAERNPWIRYGSMITGLFGILLFLLLNRRPEWALRIVPVSLYAYLAGVWVVFPILLTLGTGREAMDSDRKRRALDALAVAAVGYWTIQVAWFLLPLGLPTEASEPFDPEHPRVQSTDFTCGAASAVALLHAHDIKTTEREMARLTLTRRWIGVNSIGLYRGLKEKVEGTPLRPVIRRPSYEELKNHVPGLFSTKFEPLVDHSMCLLEVKADAVRVYDPLVGIRTIHRSDFLRKWRGNVITLERK